MAGHEAGPCRGDAHETAQRRCRQIAARSRPARCIARPRANPSEAKHMEAPAPCTRHATHGIGQLHANDHLADTERDQGSCALSLSWFTGVLVRTSQHGAGAHACAHKAT
eukprot:6211760-Pleurochrysis_carterae.AAC.4